MELLGVMVDTPSVPAMRSSLSQPSIQPTSHHIPKHFRLFSGTVWFPIQHWRRNRQNGKASMGSVDLGRAVFLDRDGVVNRPIVRNGRPYAPTAMSEWQLMPGIHDCVEKLKAAGFKVIIVT